jgi:prepilin-type N-terminal cleavage/methylation domain-containing protein
MKRNNAFTLVELIIVIAVLSILVALGMLAYTNITRSARDLAIKADINIIEDAITMANAKDGSDIRTTVSSPKDTVYDQYGNNTSTAGSIWYKIDTISASSYIKKLSRSPDYYYVSSSGQAYSTTPLEDANYKHPPVPEGLTHTVGEWNSGYVIKDGSNNEWVWVPVGSLSAGLVRHPEFHGGISGIDYTYYSDGTNLGTTPFNELAEGEGIETINDAVKKSGGFYIMRYEASVNGADASAMAKSTVNSVPWTSAVTSPVPLATFNIAKDRSESMGTDYGYTSNVKTHLLYGAEWDTTVAWLISSGVITGDLTNGALVETPSDLQEFNGADWGNYNNDTLGILGTPANTGAYESTKKNNIYDLSGNVWEWTMEVNTNTLKDGKSPYSGSLRVLRSGSFYNSAISSTVVSRASRPEQFEYADIGFRAGLVCVQN